MNKQNLTLDQIILLQMLLEKIGNSNATLEQTLEMIQIINKVVKDYEQK